MFVCVDRMYHGGSHYAIPLPVRVCLDADRRNTSLLHACQGKPFFIFLFLLLLLLLLLLLHFFFQLVASCFNVWSVWIEFVTKLRKVCEKLLCFRITANHAQIVRNYSDTNYTFTCLLAPMRPSLFVFDM